MKYTSNYKLKKPEGSDIVNIDDLNDNADIIDTELNKKVVKVSGKGLSTNDYTNTEKDKLENIQNDAEKNKIELDEHKAEKANLTKPGHIRMGIDRGKYHTELTLLNGWQGKIAYTKDDVGNVHLYATGTLRGGVMEKGTVIAMLPEGYRPAQHASILAITTSNEAVSTDFGVIEIGYNGEIKATSKPISDYSYFHVVFGTERPI